VLFSKLLHQLQQAVGAASEEGIGLALGDQAFNNSLDIFNRARVVGIEDRDDLSAQLFEHLLRHQNVRFACAENSSDAHAMIGCKLRQWRQRREPDAASEHHDIFPVRFELETVSQRSGDIELTAWFEFRHAASAAPLGLVEELDPTGGFVDPVHTHRPAHPDFGAIR
jgi:hypothetical protein